MYKPARLLGILLVVGGCSDDTTQTTPDGPPPSVDAPPAATTIEDLPITETKTFPGLSAAVEVVVDDRGAPHIYAANLNDAIRVQAYLMARDRFGQMEFFRRLTLGKLAEIFGGLDPSTAVSDRESRFIGYNRSGADIYASLAPGDISRQVAEAFVDGVNVYIDEIKAATDKSPYVPPGGELLGLIYTSEKFTHWEPADIFALARFQTATFSYDPDVDIMRTKALAGIQREFGTDPLRKNSFVDLFTEIQARRVYVMDDFPAKPSQDAARRVAAATPTPLPNMASLDAASEYFATWREHRGFFGSEGSNNWVVSGSKSASGAPMLANDPHISLISPGVWWFTHINTKRFGTADGVNVSGVAFAALPGVVLGFNDDMAWGATVTGYDVTDIYEETVTGGLTGTVLFNGNQVPITHIDEPINVGGADTHYTIDVVPHHGPIIPGTLADGKALTVKYTGFAVSNELAYFLGLASSKNVADAWAAQQAFKVGSQNFVTIARDGDIAWNTSSRIPKRDPRSETLLIDADTGAITGICPTFVLPGTGEYEWVGDLEDEFIPKLKNPAKGFIATANADNVGVTDDGNPCNDAHYVGGGFADGYRVGRIVERLTMYTAGGNMTPEQMRLVQAESQSQLGDTLRDPLVAILTAVVADAGAPFTTEEKTQLTDVKDRLAAWSSRQTPSGVGETDAAVVADSIATTIFAVGLTRIIPRAFKDEADKIGVQPPSDRAAILLERALTTPQMLATYDSGSGESTLWDDVNTAEVETKNVIVARGFLDAIAFIKSKLGDDPDGWRWGRLHTVRFTSVIPALGTDQISIPTPDDTANPDGFPRHADFGAPDVGNYSMWAPQSFRYTAGPSQRLVVEMLSTGPEARNALPGGQDINKDHPHHADEAQMWIKNENKQVYFREIDVVQHHEARRRFVP